MIRKIINQVFDNLEDNNFAALGREDKPMWEKPIIGVAAGDDSYYDFLKEHIGEFHWSPEEVFNKKYGGAAAEDLRVISMILPQTEETKRLQKAQKNVPSDEWITSRGEWEAFIKDFCQRLEAALEAEGIRCAFPDLTAGMKRMDSENVGIASTWSQRHTAYAAGLGTFGLNDGLITEEGIAIRLTSFVMEADKCELPVRGRVSDDPYGWCTRCGACIGRCPAGAISLEGGHNKEICSAYKEKCRAEMWPEELRERYESSGCGLCQAGIPCSSRRP